MSSHRLLFFFYFLVSLLLRSSSFLQASGDEIPTIKSIHYSSFPAALQLLQKQIGYQFEVVDLLQRAMTHRSYSRDNNRLLSDLGLSTIHATVSLRFISRNPEMSPKELNRRISEITGGDACRKGALRLGLEKVVRVSLKTNASSPTVVCGAFRAIFGAVAVGAGKVDSAGDVFWRSLGVDGLSGDL